MAYRDNECNCNYGKPGPKKGSSYGAAAIGHAVAGAEFPMSKQELLQKYGDREVQLTKGSPMKLRDILETSNIDTFNSVADVEHAFHKEYTGE